MHTILLFSALLATSGSLAEFIITAHDRLVKDVDERGLFGFDVKSFLKKNGYPFENHVVTTEDGYNLSIHRIPYGRDDADASSETKKPVVLLMHGLGSSSVDYFILGAGRSLALELADVGYDVWLGNNRGNTWSRDHISLDPDNSTEFWDFSFHELGMYDLPATIDYVLKVTQTEKISYIGHSQGATQFFALASEVPEYNDQFNIVMALAPAVYSKNMSNPIIQIITKFYTLFDIGTNFLNITEVLGHSFIIETALKLVCKDGSQYQEVCPFILFLIFGFDSAQFDRSTITTILDVFPAGFSIKELKHFFQLAESGRFRQFDYGILNNLDKYGKAAPPDYNLTRVTAPVALYYGKNDWLVAVTNVEQLADELPNVVENYLIEYDYFNHIDFLFAKDAYSMLYFDLINKLNEVNGLNLISSTPSTTSITPKTTSSKVIPTAPGNNTTSSEDGDPKTPETTTQINPESTTTGSARSFTSVAQTVIFVMLLINFVM